jgi:hypothetical protein
MRYPQSTSGQSDNSRNSSFTNIVQSFPGVDADARSLVIRWLTRSTRYYIRVRGFNAVGTGAWSTLGM